MAEKHNTLVARYRDRLRRKGYIITKKSPFVDYKPDICATKEKEKVFAEVELEKSLHSDHTLGQLNSMYRYLRKSRNYTGVLVVPKGIISEARFLIQMVFGDIKVKAVGI